MADIIDKEFVATKIKEYADKFTLIATFLGSNGQSWKAPYGEASWSIAEGIANSINEKVVDELDKEIELREEAILDEAAARESADQAIINILNTTYKDKINEIIAAVNTLGADPAIDPLP